FLSIWIHLREQVGKRRAPAKIDLILCSDTGNTAHYANQFIKGAERGGAEVTAHRFHRRNEFNPSLNGDALVVAFPVSGWKPPWPLLDWLSSSLPHGAGKPAFCLYTSAGGPENAGISIWVHLTVRGYRVCGRMWAAYPLNVPTLRIGPASLWKFLDRQVPIEEDLKAAEEAGEAFARGGRAGLPIVFWPSLLWLLGYLLDNRWINVFLYRNYVWKGRCNHCNRCIEHCPIERLRLVDGFPRPVGTCALCLGCINLCPKNAMHMACWTEYGNPYKPRWPGLVVKRKHRRRTDPDE
ncbi:MAG: hypothetical protein HYU64_12235, partial [Armatimonadetes bacterium]|nr:hypothetical protein [Armatimonadota bacterium]